MHSRTIRPRILGIGVALALAGGLAACAPGPAGYAGWSGYRQQQASAHAYQAQRDARTAQWQAETGDYGGARQSQAASNAEAVQADQARSHAARDRWLSQF